MNMKTPYNGALTRERFLFHEMRTTAELISEGLADEEILDRIFIGNLFQLPTEKSIRSLARACIKRLRGLNDDGLVRAIVTLPSDMAKQICLYALMRQNGLVWDFMLTVIGEKYRVIDFSFSRMDVNTFMARLQEQNETVASWSDATTAKIKSVLVGILIQNGYLDSPRSRVLNPVLIGRELEFAMRKNHDEAALPAFNCFSQ